MTKTLRDDQITTRMLQWLDEEYGARGKFTTLQNESGIPVQRWKNVYYKRQFATPEMLEFVQKKSTDSYQWVITGVRKPWPEGYPFRTSPPTENEQKTLAGRLTWAIKEFVGPRGVDLYLYLASKSNDKIKVDQWADMVLGISAPTLEMLEVVSAYSLFTEWIVKGKGSFLDPGSDDSINRWRHIQEEQSKKMWVSINKKNAENNASSEQSVPASS